MAGSRTLKLSILGDVDNLNKSLKTATADVETFGDKMGKVGKAVGAAFVAAAAAAGAYAVKIGIDGVKAALEDEKAQRILALTLENTTKATKAQISAVEDYITEVALATGVTDDELRPALSRLVRSTKDTEEAQKLLSLALDISSATGKPLEAIANSLGKAYDGNTNALGKLGLGIDQSILKTKDFNKVYESLRGSFAGFAEQEANTFQGRLDRLNVAFDEAKETIGFALLPVFEKLITFVNDNALPIINALADGFSVTSSDGLGKSIADVGNTIKNVVQPIFEGFQKAVGFIKDAITDSKDEFMAFWEVIKYIAPLIGKAIGAAIGVIGPIASVVITVIGKVLAAIKPLLNFAIDGINAIITGINLIKPGSDIGKLQRIGDAPAIAGFSGTMPNGQAFTTTSSSAGAESTAIAVPNIPTIDTTGVSAVSKSAAAASSSNVISNNFNPGRFRMGEAASMSTINLTVNGAMDKEGTARTIIDTLNNSFFRGTGGAGNFVTT
jgi:phage-related protein